MKKTKRSPKRYSGNMKNFRSFFIAAAVVSALSSCSEKASISGVLTGAPGADLIVKQLSGNTYNVLDTLKTDASGAYTYKLEVAGGQPEFVYLFHGSTKVASLLLIKGDRVKVVSDTLGNYSVEGSEESAKLQKVEEDFAAFMGKFASDVASGSNADASKDYIAYYRDCVKYVLENSKSLTAIPVLYQKINENFPVFSQPSDAIHFKNVHDSLMTVYPDSRYVAALGKEAERRGNLLSLNNKIQSAEQIAYPDIEMPSIKGEKVKLSEVNHKVVLVYFWQAREAAQKMFNQDVLLPLYRQYHDKGLEIYAVSLDTDKGVWASAVNSQRLPWINVCDGLGVSSQAIVLYNLGKGLPVIYPIINGALAPETVTSEESLRRILAANL